MPTPSKDRKAAAERAKRRLELKRAGKLPTLPEWPAGKPFPNFATDEEEENFFHSHSFAEHWQAKLKLPKPRTKPHTVRLADDEWKRLDAAARNVLGPGHTVSDLLSETAKSLRESGEYTIRAAPARRVGSKKK